jgi:hypothetical protein
VCASDFISGEAELQSRPAAQLARLSGAGGFRGRAHQLGILTESGPLDGNGDGARDGNEYRGNEPLRPMYLLRVTEWEDGRRPLIERLAGVLLLVSLAANFVDPAGTSNKLFATLSTQQIVEWAAHNGSGISVTGFVDGLQNSLLAVAVVLLVRLIRGRGVLAAAAYVSVAAFMAIGWVKAGTTWALADTAEQSGSDAVCSRSSSSST